MELESRQATRGYGLLENFLAKIRAEKVDKIIPDRLRTGRILDFGCGSYPYFLHAVEFKEKFGLDKSLDDADASGISVRKFDLEIDRALPFPDGYFSVVTSLAVAEHLYEQSAIELWREINRVLMPGGIFILTTPASETKGILDLMAKLGLASAEEVADHKQFYTKEMLVSQLLQAGFDAARLKVVRFECGANLLAAANK